jgi:type IV pilus assembly protein PilY1
MPSSFNILSRLGWIRSRTRMQKFAALAILASVVTTGVVISAVTLPPLVELSSEPLYMNGAKAKANLTLALSVEFPTVGQTYRDTFNEAKTYVGYFDNQSCYKHVPANGAIGAYFDWTGAVNGSGSCGGGGFNGNFMNWATSSAVDILRYGLTGGNRVIDDGTGASKTVVERAWLPDDFYRNDSYFSEKVLPKALVSKMIETSAANKLGANDMYIYNCRDRVYFAKSKDTTGGCTNPFGVANAASDQLLGPNNNDTYYEVRNLVCDANSATNRLMSYDPDTKKWKGLCFRYPSGKYKPVGQFQMNAENLRVGVFGYLQDDSRERYGGVMRAPLKYLGPKAYDVNFNLIAGANPRSEWDATTGVFTVNPQSGDSKYGAQGHAKSGAINYVNKFGTLDSSNIGKYKGLDPVSELYYEALRYLQGKQPTDNAVSFTGLTAAQKKTMKEDFPVYDSWDDPFTGFKDTTGTNKSCLRNSILTIADVFTHSDRSVPGNSNITNQDFLRAAETNPSLDVPFWTSIVGSFEANSGAVYTDSEGRAQTASNIAGNSPYYSALTDAATMDTGATGGSHYLAGMAYWANTQSYRTDIPKARVTTYGIDVNERRASDDVDFRRTRQLYLAGKYGGFTDSSVTTGNTGFSGNPYATGDNTLWIGADGDAKNYFLVSDAQKFLDSIADVFAKVVEETGSISGGAISTQRLSSGEAAGVFQARFNPVANYWSGRLLKYALSLSTDKTKLVIADTPTWEAGDVLTKQTKLDHGVSRNIIIGSPLGTQTTVAPSEFKWGVLATAHQTELNTNIANIVDTLGSDRLDYIRGDRRKEISPTAPTNTFRPRDIVLGDIVNSGLVYQGGPSTAISDASYETFYTTNKTREPVIFVNANDGMLHAFNNTDGKEAFAYIPGFLANKLSNLPDQDYSHISMADATPAVAEAQIGTTWHSVLVSGVGGGAQGVYALDVTKPSAFTKDNVMWEFTDRDHPAMGNVIGSPRIVKIRTTNSSATTAAYKWYAVVASGVNNYAADAYPNTGGNSNPSIFLLDLSYKPFGGGGWVEGANFWRIEIPQSSVAIAKGLAGFSVTTNFNTSALESLYAGDMQGNVWKLDFSLNGSSNLGTNATTNLTKFNLGGGSTPFFIAIDSANNLQPITGEPAVTNGTSGNKLVSFGTGKFLETADTVAPLTTGASFYTLLDQDKVQVINRSKLQAGTVDSAGNLDIPQFTYGYPTTAASSLRMGWYFDFDKSIAERQVSDITAVAGKLFFASLYPTKGSCGEGGGRLYVVNTLTGDGTSEESKVGILAAPLVVDLGSFASATPRETSGKRFGSTRYGVITQGSRGMQVASGPIAGGGYTGTTMANSWLSWRQLNNFQEEKNKP